MFIFHNSFSLRLTENLHEQKHFIKTRSTCFVYIIFFLKCIIKKSFTARRFPYTGPRLYITLYGSEAFVLLLLLLLKKVGSARLRESDVHPISPKTPAPQYQPVDRKKRQGKRVEDYSKDRAA